MKKRAFPVPRKPLPRMRARTGVRIQPRRPRGRPRAEDLEALEARLLATARQAFVMSGYGAASMNAIAKTAAVSKNTLYARFPSKAALFRAIVEQQIASAKAEIAPSRVNSQGPLDKRLRDTVARASSAHVSFAACQVTGGFAVVDIDKRRHHAKRVVDRRISTAFH